MRLAAWINAAPILALLLAACSDAGDPDGTSGSPAGQRTSTSARTSPGPSTSTLSDAGGGGAGQHTDAAADAARPATGLMSTCKVVGVPGDCGAGLQCFNFPSKGMVCTRSCTKATEAADCPQPQTGGCNNQGVCRPPG